MIQAKIAALVLPRQAKIRELLRSTPPCITVMLPPFGPGEQAKSMASLLKTELQEAQRRLERQKIPEYVIMDLLEPLEQLTQEDELLGGSHCGRAILRSPEVFEQFELLAEPAAALTVGDSFQIRPILMELHLSEEFYVLKLSKKDVGLLRCAHFCVETVDLPRGVPETLAEALAFRPPDHDLENRASAGGSVGSMRGVRFGTGSGRETQHTYLADYYKAVDRGITAFLYNSKAPLILAGVVEDTNAYAAINTYPDLLKPGIHGSPGASLPDKELMRVAYEIIQSDGIQRAVQTFAEFKERLSPTRVSTDLPAILEAAADGRVSHLYIDEHAQALGSSQSVEQGGRLRWDSEDLLNVAAVETILHDGQAFSLPSDHMPDAAAAIAFFRY